MKTYLLLPLLFFASCSGSSLAESQQISYPIGNLDSVQVAVKTPAGKFLYLYDEQYQCNGVRLIGGSVTIDLDSASGVYWNDGGRHFSQVFARAGVYKIYISDNLETEEDNATTNFYRYVSRGGNKGSATPSCQEFPLTRG